MCQVTKWYALTLRFKSLLLFNYCLIFNKYFYENNTDKYLSAHFRTYLRNFQKFSE
nr:MAG TPA: hypothetical protein [Caudoviricetes sp.]